MNECGDVIGMVVSRADQPLAEGINYSAGEPMLRAWFEMGAPATTGTPTTTLRPATTQPTTPPGTPGVYEGKWEWVADQRFWGSLLAHNHSGGLAFTCQPGDPFFAMVATFDGWWPFAVGGTRQEQAQIVLASERFVVADDKSGAAAYSGTLMVDTYGASVMVSAEELWSEWGRTKNLVEVLINPPVFVYVIWPDGGTDSPIIEFARIALPDPDDPCL